MTDLNTLRSQLDSGEHVFADTLAFIAQGYTYQPQAFTNGGVENAAGQNEGSCKTLGLALLDKGFGRPAPRVGDNRAAGGRQRFGQHRGDQLGVNLFV